MAAATIETVSNMSDEDDEHLSEEDAHNHTITSGATNHSHTATTVGGIINGGTNGQQQPQYSAAKSDGDLAANLFKWTNYIHGWQERYIVLKDGILSYYKSEHETQFGCRGAIALKQSSIIPHDLDDCRFDIRVNDSVWYLRANSPEERQRWFDALEEQRVESGYGSQTNLRRHGSRHSLNSTASLSVASTGSSKRSGLGLKEKLAEMDTFKDILCRQVEALQAYFDACANATTKGFEPYHKELERMLNEVDVDGDGEDGGGLTLTANGDNSASKQQIRDHAAMAIDFKGEAFTFKATATGILHDFSHCIELMQQREDWWKRKFEREQEKRKKLDEQIKELQKAVASGKKNIIIAGPDFEEGPHSTLKEEMFFDAVDSTLDTLEEQEDRRVQALDSLTNIPHMNLQSHRMSDQVEKVVQEHLKYDLIDDLSSNVWELLCSEGEMKVYRRELEENGIVLDPLKAVHTVRGVTAHEMCKYFWDPAVRMEWEGTLDSTRVVEALSDDTLVFHQVHKRVWPSAQRDTCFWSHIRPFARNKSADRVETSDDIKDWIVVNYSTEHEKAPPKEPQIRATANVAMICSTKLDRVARGTNLNEIRRENLVCTITYVAHVNPGGWAPASVLRAVYKREYPKFVKRFTQYVIDKCAKKPIIF